MALQVKNDIFQMITDHQKNLGQTQTDMVKAAPAEQQDFLKAQFKLENEAQAADAIGKLLKQDETLTVIRNLS
jgi:hypothetical protein